MVHVEDKSYDMRSVVFAPQKQSHVGVKGTAPGCDMGHVGRNGDVMVVHSGRWNGAALSKGGRGPRGANRPLGGTPNSLYRHGVP